MISKTTSLVLGIIMILTAPLLSQNDKSYYDFNIDYFPRVKFIKRDSILIQNLKLNENRELTEIIDELTKRLLDTDKYIVEMSGFKMVSSGIFPKELTLAEKWIKIEVNEGGNVEVINVYQNGAQFNEKLSLQYKKALDKVSLFPALKSLKPVKITLFYLVKSK